MSPLHPTMQAATRGMFGQDREPETDEAKIFRLEQELRQAKFTARCLQDKVWHLEEAADINLPRITFETNSSYNNDPQCAHTHDVDSALIAQAVNELIERHADELQERCEQLQRAEWSS